jgi:excisionase family DNA binding protein
MEMRGLGDFQRAQMRDIDPRVAELFGHLRRALDTLEQIMLRPRQRNVEPRPQVAEQRICSVVMAPAVDAKLAYTVKEVRKLVGISTTTFYQLVGSGELKAVKRGARTLVLAKDLRDWLERLPLARQSKRDWPMTS